MYNYLLEAGLNLACHVERPAFEEEDDAEDVSEEEEVDADDVSCCTTLLVCQACQISWL